MRMFDFCVRGLVGHSSKGFELVELENVSRLNIYRGNNDRVITRGLRHSVCRKGTVRLKIIHRRLSVDIKELTGNIFFAFFLTN